MAAGKEMFCIRKRELIGNGKMWMDGKDGVYQHPVNERLLRGIKKSWPKKDYQVLGPWSMYQEWLENGSTQKQPEKEQEPEETKAKTEPEIPAKEEEVKVGQPFFYAQMNMAQLREHAKGKIDATELNTFKGVKGKQALIKRLEEI